MKKFFFSLSVSGFFLTLLVHLMSANNYDLENDWPYVLWVMHAGVFVVWIPTVIYQLTYGSQNEEEQGSGFLRYGKRSHSLFWVLKKRPLWLRILVYLSFAYAFINMIIVAVHDPGLGARSAYSPDYHYFRALRLMNFSGFWIVFYLGAVAILYPSKKVKN